jgi:hypothetical protein
MAHLHLLSTANCEITGAFTIFVLMSDMSLLAYIPVKDLLPESNKRMIPWRSHDILAFS